MGKLKEWLGALKGKISWVVSILIVVSAVITEIETGVVRNTAAEAKAWWNAPAQNVSSDVIVDVLYASVSMRCSHAEPPEGTGSGVLLHKWGHTNVITAAHVIRCEVGGTNFTMYAYQGTNTWRLKLINVSVDQDLALLRVESPGLFGQSIRWFNPLGVPPAVGTRVLHIGNLFGEMSHSLSEGLSSCPNLGDEFEQVFRDRIREADEFYAHRLPHGLTDDERRVVRQAYAGLLWGKQFYHYIVRDWLDGDPEQPPPPAQRATGRNAGWPHVYNRDVISMPDKWEYPWYVAWDLAFDMIPLARIDPDFAKQQLVLFLREWYMHANGQLPAYEFDFGDVNPPVHAWACWRAYKMTGARGARDRMFLSRCFQNAGHQL